MSHPQVLPEKPTENCITIDRYIHPMEPLSEEKKARIERIFKELEGTIEFDGTACDLIRELRKTGFNKVA